MICLLYNMQSTTRQVGYDGAIGMFILLSQATLQNEYGLLIQTNGVNRETYNVKWPDHTEQQNEK